MSKISEALALNKNGLHYNNRLILPFKCHLLKIMIEEDIITDFSSCSPHVDIMEYENFTDIYFKKYKDLKDELSQFENIKMIICEKDADIFDLNSHLKLILYLENDHIVRIETPSENQIVID